MVVERSADVLTGVSFGELKLSSDINAGLSQHGFSVLSPVQLMSIPHALSGKDVVIQAKSGTGKTLCFAIVALETVSTTLPKPQVVVITPTREIAVQVTHVISSVGSHLSGLRIHSFIGGTSVFEDKKHARGCHIAVGTPGRMCQLIDEGALDLSDVSLFVLDEADHLMDDSFRENVENIFDLLSSSTQILALSATFPTLLEENIVKHMKNPEIIRVQLDSLELIGIEQYVSILPSPTSAAKLQKMKVEHLLKIFEIVEFSQCMLFTNFQTRAESIASFLTSKGWPSRSLSAHMDQTSRLQTLAYLQQMKCRIVVCTDLAARGIDAENVDLIINVDVPVDSSTYLHRIGRAGRFGGRGVAVTLAAEGEELEHMRSVVSTVNVKIRKLSENLDVLLRDERLNLELLEGNGKILQNIDYAKRREEMKKKRSHRKRKERENNEIHSVSPTEANGKLEELTNETGPPERNVSVDRKEETEENEEDEKGSREDESHSVSEMARTREDGGACERKLEKEVAEVDNTGESKDGKQKRADDDNATKNGAQTHEEDAQEISLGYATYDGKREASESISDIPVSEVTHVIPYSESREGVQGVKNGLEMPELETAEGSTDADEDTVSSQTSPATNKDERSSESVNKEKEADENDTVAVVELCFSAHKGLEREADLGEEDSKETEVITSFFSDDRNVMVTNERIQMEDAQLKTIENLGGNESKTLDTKIPADMVSSAKEAAVADVEGIDKPTDDIEVVLDTAQPKDMAVTASAKKVDLVDRETSSNADIEASTQDSAHASKNSRDVPDLIQDHNGSTFSSDLKSSPARKSFLRRMVSGTRKTNQEKNKSEGRQRSRSATVQPPELDVKPKSNTLETSTVSDSSVKRRAFRPVKFARKALQRTMSLIARPKSPNSYNPAAVQEEEGVHNFRELKSPALSSLEISPVASEHGESLQSVKREGDSAEPLLQEEVQLGSSVVGDYHSTSVKAIVVTERVDVEVAGISKEQSFVTGGSSTSKPSAFSTGPQVCTSDVLGAIKAQTSEASRISSKDLRTLSDESLKKNTLITTDSEHDLPFGLERKYIESLQAVPEFSKVTSSESSKELSETSSVKEAKPNDSSQEYSAFDKQVMNMQNLWYGHYYQQVNMIEQFVQNCRYVRHYQAANYY